MPADLLVVADAVCLILGLGQMVESVTLTAPVRPVGKPNKGIAADALERVQVEVASYAWCAMLADIPKREAAREKRLAKGWERWEGTPGARV